MSDKIRFKTLVSIEEAIKILEENYNPPPPDIEEVNLTEAYGRILAEDIVSPIDIPPFTRATRDGYAVKYEDISMAMEDNPVKLKVIGSIEAGSRRILSISHGEAVKVATGAPLPAGANTIVMMEYTQERDGYVYIYKRASPGEWIQHAGSDVRRGEVIYYKGILLGPRELGVIGGLGIDKVRVYRKRKVAYISTGDELTRPGRGIGFGEIYDINIYSLTASLVEDGFQVIDLGIARDNVDDFINKITIGIKYADLIVLSGSTSVGGKDILFEAVTSFEDYRILFHGVKTKPGKPTLASFIGDKLLIGLPGFPVSALMIYIRIFSNVLRRANMYPPRSSADIKAVSGYFFRSEPGVRQLYPVYLKRSAHKILFYPIKTESGALATLSYSDGFIEIPENTMYVNRGDEYTVKLFSNFIRPADIINLTSHSIALDNLLKQFYNEFKYNLKRIVVGSTGALIGVREGYSDFGGIHLLDENGEYNVSYIKKYNVNNAILYHGFYRNIGFVVKKGNPKKITSFRDLLRDDVKFINRVGGSGIRVYIDLMLYKLAKEMNIEFSELIKKIDGYTVEAKTHSAIVNAVAAGLYDVGIATKLATLGLDVDFIPLTWERYDFIFNRDRLSEEPIKNLIKYLGSDGARKSLKKLPGIRVDSNYMMLLIE
ncbi:molybdopterin biosynthesis protein [Candidatus Geothermarchaeota archaeon]|nr:MAG: molybdopterin biosynthesis protein [Candidatus Geothermarchaeota archaeon]HEW93758.1 molybdopterin biosynthesis protein [Thermoprotei archaeon]